jgi:aspartyl-tRNA(Asn)/glutamyl-tRNA(Gln) amidotransferase subunit B
VAEKAIADYFEEVAEGPRRQAGRQLGDQRAVRAPEQGRQGIAESPVSPAQLGGIIDLIKDGTSPARSPRTCSRSSGTEGGDPAKIVESAA